MSAKKAQTPDGHYTVEELRDRKKTSAAVFFGLCAENGWGAGRTVTEAEYDAALKAFGGGVVGRRKK